MRPRHRLLSLVLEVLDSRVLLSQFFVAPTGAPSGDGSLTHPWDLQTALNEPSAVHPGDEIWVLGGTYLGNYTSYLTGTATAPIVVRAYKGQRATLDGGLPNSVAPTLTIKGPDSWFWDLEIINSNPVRVVSYPGSAGPRGDGVANYAPGTKLIDLVVHDAADGISTWSTGTTPSNTEVYGSIIYNNGWQGPDRGHGHGIYAQNLTGSKYFTDNIIFDNFGYSFHAYTESNAINNMVLVGNDVFHSGGLAGPDNGHGILVGGFQVAQNPVVTDNTVYNTGSGAYALEIGYSAGASDATVAGNDLYASGAAFYSVNSTYLAVGNNLFDGPVSSSGTAQDLLTGNSVLPVGTHPSQNQVFVRPDAYEPGRANITVFNWAGQNSVSVDVSSAGLAVGQRFKVVDAQNFYGPPILQGKYNGGLLSLPMTETVVAQPVGDAPLPAVHTGIEYGSFVLLPLGSKSWQNTSGSFTDLNSPTGTVNPYNSEGLNANGSVAGSSPLLVPVVNPSQSPWIRRDSRATAPSSSL